MACRFLSEVDGSDPVARMSQIELYHIRCDRR
nr:MAG TPA: hypothetical protein [Caudoviricetes sp.]